MVAGKRVFDSIGIEDVEGSRWIGKVLRDGVRVRDRVGKRVGVVKVEIMVVVDEGRSVIGKVLREVVYVMDEKRSSVVRLLGDVVGVVDGGWRHVKRVISDGIGVEGFVPSILRADDVDIPYSNRGIIPIIAPSFLAGRVLVIQQIKHQSIII